MRNGIFFTLSFGAQLGFMIMFSFVDCCKTLTTFSIQFSLYFIGPPMDERLHNGGAMAFGNDGKLYITMGDAGKRHNAGTFDDVHGSIIRLNDDGSVPDDNPYTKASGYPNSYRCADTEGRVPENAPKDSYCAEVWANGLRNPFRIDMDPNVKDKVKFSFGVVGAQHIEAIYHGGTDYKGTNYGWPKYEGVCRPGDISDCEPNDNPAVTMPFHWYEHISYENGGCVGGQVHVPEGIWPPEFKYLFLDFILLQIYSLEENRPDLACDECYPPLPPTKNETFFESIQQEEDNINEARLVEMWFGPYKDTQALYVTKFGNHDTVLRIRYNGILNKPPKPTFDFEYDDEVTIKVDASLTIDPEGDRLKYEWDFGDESALLVGQSITSHQYSQPGEYAITLKVTDTSGQEQQVSDTIKVGTVPKVKITLPPENTTFAVGQVLRLKGEALDFLGNPIPDEQLTWEVRQVHADHFHPFLDLTIGNDFDLYQAPDPEDYLAATNSFLRVLLTAKDQYGLSETVSVDVQPNIIIVNVTTQPPGLDVVVDGFNIETPELITSWKGFKLPVTVADQPPYVFKEWSDGRTARTRKFSIYQKANEPLPQVQAIFCSSLAAQCEDHDECCSGYCSAEMSGICGIMPPLITDSPSHGIVPDPLPSELEIDIAGPSHTNIEEQSLELSHQNVDDPKQTILDEESSLSENTSVSGDIDAESEGFMDIVLEYIPYAAIVVVLLILCWFVAKYKCNKCKKPAKSVQHVPYYDDESESDPENGNDEYYDGGVDIKATSTGSTEESEDLRNHISSLLPYDNVCNNSDISLSFLVPESMSSEPGHVEDIENQGGAAPDSPASAAVTDTYLMPPLSPALSLTHTKLRCFDNAQEEQETEVEGILEYRFDAASTSQSSLILPTQCAGLDQESFDGILADRSVSLSISSPQKSVIQAIAETDTLPDSNSFSGSDESSEDRGLGETSEVIDSLVLSYFSEKAATANISRDDKSASVLPPIPDTSDSSNEEEMDEDERVLDLLLSAVMDEQSLKNLTGDLTLSFLKKDQKPNQEDDDAEVRSSDPTKLTEESSTLSQLCIVSTAEEAECPGKESEFSIETISHDNSESSREVNLSLLKSPALESKQRSATKNIKFISPEANYSEKQKEGTPETHAMFDADSSLLTSTSDDTNESDINYQSKATGMNLQSTFAASVNKHSQVLPDSISQQLNEEVNQ